MLKYLVYVALLTAEVYKGENNTMILEAMTGNKKAEEKLNEIMSIVNVLNDMTVDLSLTEFMGITIAMFDEYCDDNEISPAEAHGELVKYIKIWDVYHGITA